MMTYNEFLEFLAQAYDKFNSNDGEAGPSYYNHAFMCFVLDDTGCMEENLIRQYFQEFSRQKWHSVPCEYKSKLKRTIQQLEDDIGDTWRIDVFRKLDIEYCSNRVKYRQANLHRPIWIREQIN